MMFQTAGGVETRNAPPAVVFSPRLKKSSDKSKKPGKTSPDTHGADGNRLKKDPDLLPRIADGDATAVDEFITRYQRLIWWLARRQAGHDAEDAVQDIFIDLWKSAARFDASKSSEVSFITMIARRRLIDRSRKRQRTPLTQELDLDLVDQQFQTSSAEIEIAAEARIAAEALSELQPEQRSVLKLSIVEGYSHGEIARQTGIPLGTVKSHIRRGLIQVKQSLAESGGSQEVPA